jgi:hypothetical protein
MAFEVLQIIRDTLEGVGVIQSIIKYHMGGGGLAQMSRDILIGYFTIKGKEKLVSCHTRGVGGRKYDTKCHIRGGGSKRCHILFE